MPILIKTNFNRRNQTTRCTPEVPDNFEDFKSRLRNIERVAQGNNYPWKWREEPKS